jgi:hypothetical protein
MKIDEMPQTFQNAIKVARDLGFQNLWIDSLCIVQDDLADWQDQSVRMRQVFRDASLVIVASRSAADVDGFLKKRSEGAIASIPSLTSILGVPCFIQYDKSEWRGSEPLESRAWTMQEVLLARRKLMFLQNGMIWSCSTHETAEVGGQERPDRFSSLLFRKLSLDQEDTLDTKESKYQLWQRLVEEYSGRRLTFEKDVFPALSGLATIVGDLIHEHYVAGFWEGDLPQSLLWRRAIYGGKRHSSFIAPSWSWASAGRRVFFICQSFWGLLKTTQWYKISTVVSYSLHLDSPSKYGALSSGSLILASPIIQISGIRGPFDPEPIDGLYESRVSEPYIAVVLKIGGRTVAISGDIDDRNMLQNMIDSMDSYFFAPIMQLKEPPFGLPIMSWRRMFGLILRRLDSGQYSRVGVVHGSFVINSGHLHDNTFIEHYWGEAVRDMRATQDRGAYFRSTRWHPVDLRDHEKTELTII